MATDYSKKTNAELIEILKSRNLPHTGKKAEMVARLQENDNSAAPSEEKPAAAAATKGSGDNNTDDVIDWEDDEVPAGEAAAKASTATGAAAIAAGGKGEVENPVKVPNQKLDEEANPATANDLKVEQPGDAAQQQSKEEEGAAAAAAGATEKEGEEEKKPAVTYSAGLPITEMMEEELKKRKARAEKFGVTEESKAAIEAAEKQLERAKRFGTAAPAPGEVGVKKLDEALPEKEEKSRKRGRGDEQSGGGGRGGKKRDLGGRNRFRGRGGHGGNRNQGQGRPQKQQNGGGATAAAGAKTTNWSEKDVQAMEARKKRFGAAA
ncbi:hypothetical protein AnigIFM63604_001583 [Aspergillus niger]|uniref:SAP domain-containing protein n=1 Tax=Aspergillus niger TaxID=5061 RepID=A0A9W6ABE5_ASPNG|nr:hypothetical protein AnigIFM63604_001583 [Aspergillus niger]